MTDIKICKIDEVRIRIKCDEHIKYELKDWFKFRPPGFQFVPSYKNKYWDGYIYLYDIRNSSIYKGLHKELEAFCEDYEYEFEYDDGVIEPESGFTLDDAKLFYQSLELPDNLEYRDFQLASFQHCVQNHRALFVSPTGSGKSLLIYLLLRYYQDEKTLIIVDSINLLNQMYSDFKDYGFDVEENIHLISAGSDKISDKRIIVSTWQSAARQPKEWFNQFGLVVGDEAHKYKAKELTKILESLNQCKLRFGFTGSLDGSITNKLVLQGLFGPHKQIVTTKQLQDQGTLSQLEIKCITLDYTDEEKKLISKAKYEDEITYLFNHKKRNLFICNLALNLNDVTLVLFRRIDHGKKIYEYLNKKADFPVYYVSGEIKGDEREEIRKISNEHQKAIIVASVGVFSTGVNIPNLKNLIFASPTKSQIQVLQSIGRILRKTETKQHCVCFDIADDLKWKSKINHTLKHYMERVKIYIDEKFKYKLFKVSLK